MNPNLIVKMIKKSLTPDLLKIKYRKKNKNNLMYGHCYVATESLYYLIRHLSSDKGYLEYKPFYGKDKSGITHWWLQNRKGNILDPTAEQYITQKKKPPYDNGHGGAFFTQKPSKRALIVIKRVLDSL